MVYILTLGIGALSSVEAETAHLVLRSEPGDFVGEGGKYDITYTTGIYAQVRRTDKSGKPTELLFALTVGGPFSELLFGTDQLGIPIQSGVYSNAQIADFADPGHPGLDVSFDGRGCNGCTGNFTVNYVSFFSDDEIASFSASFEQHCEGVAPALFGTFVYDAIPEPSTVWLVVLGIGWVILKIRWRPAAVS